jgi:hypothetical protein
MAKSSILAVSHLNRFILFGLLSWLALSACDNSTRQPKTSSTRPAVLPDSTALRTYHIALVQLATADQADRQAIFRIFRRYGFRSSQADTANRWLLRQDSLRLATFQALERRYGWPRDKAVGAGSVQQAYLLVQHAPDQIQASYQDTLRAAHARGELRSADYATYLDRVWVNQGRPQQYGTQSSRRVLANGQEEDYLFPVEDLPHLDQRRATMQLEPLLSQLRPGTTILKPRTN